MFQKIGDWFRRIMYGRYGTDRLNLLLLVIAMACSIAGNWIQSTIPAFLSTFLMIYVIFRMFSRNLTARQQEMAAYTRFKKFFTDREHRYYGCPHCRQEIRVPRGKGKLNIRCPRCGEHFVRKT